MDYSLRCRHNLSAFTKVAGADPAILMTVAESRKLWGLALYPYSLRERSIFFTFFAMENSKWY